MFGKRKKIKASRIDSCIGRHTELFGDVRFATGLLVDGTVKGNVVAEDDSSPVLELSKHGTIEGEVRVPNVILDGVVLGDVHAKEQIELRANARVKGNVYYNFIEMAMGAEVNGNLVHSVEEVESPLKLGHGGTLEVAEES